MATGPAVLPNQIFAAVGRSPVARLRVYCSVSWKKRNAASEVMIDLGGTSIGMRHLVQYEYCTHLYTINIIKYIFIYREREDRDRERERELVTGTWSETCFFSLS